MKTNIKKLEELKTKAELEIKEVQKEHELNDFKAAYLGKRSDLSQIMKTMRELSNEDRKVLGASANQFRNDIEALISKQAKIIKNQEVLKEIEKSAIDITLPSKKIKKGHIHPLTQTIREIEDAFIGMGYSIAQGFEVEEDLYNFEMLNLPKNHPARAMQDSFYINENTLLRTHTSPVQARMLLQSKGKPIKIICPGKVYRRDSDDATHSHQFMQCEGLVVSKKASMTDLKGTLENLVKCLFKDELEIRFRPSFFPFTEPSVEVDVQCFKCHGEGCGLCKKSGWIEVLGAGMVHPNVLKMAGYDTTKYQGFAFGVGIERIAMLKYGIDDIRHFYTNDERFNKQF